VTQELTALLATLDRPAGIDRKNTQSE